MARHTLTGVLAISGAQIIGQGARVARTKGVCTKKELQ